MMDDAQPTTAPSVELDGDRVLIHELSVDGHLAELVAAAAADGADAESTVRDALDIGSAVLLHGVAKSTVDAVASEVDRVLTALRERSSSLLDVGRMAERVSAKGFAYEEELGRALERNFAHADVVESTGLTPGIADDKTGDYVATLSPTETAGRALRVVVEAKAQGLSMPKTEEELDRAMLNRGAVVGIIVFRSQQAAPIRRPLRCLPGKRIVCVWEGPSGDELPLEAAIQIARALAISSERSDGELDRLGLADRIAQTVNLIEGADGIRRGIAGARRALTSTEEAWERMKNEALAVLYEIQDRL